MSKDQTSMSEELFKLDGKPSTSQALPLALQHVVAMVVGCVAPAIIISGVAGLSASDSPLHLPRMQYEVLLIAFAS